MKILIFILIVGSMFADGKKSFVIVTDTTASMREEMSTLKNHIESVVRPLPFTGDFENYILVPFTDPDVGNPRISSTPEGLLNFLSDLEIRGGNDCPENSLTAIEKALEISNDYSNIFLFTDATAKDMNKLQFIQTLCRQRQSQVVTFLSGECPGETTTENNMHIYNEIAKSCSGAAFHLDINNLQQAFKYMKEIVKVEWSDIGTHKEFMGNKQFNFEVDKYTKQFLVAVAGDYPQIQITNANGESAAVERIMDTKRALVIRLSHPQIGEYTAEVFSRGISMTTFYKWKTLEFHYGFSLKKPRSLKETSDAPIPDTTSYLIIEQLDSAIEVFLVELQQDGDKTILELEVLNEIKRLYAVQTFFKTDTPFRISIHGREKTTLEVIKGTSKIIHPQLKVPAHTIGATVEAISLESVVVEFMENVTLFSKVTGEPKPDIWWEDNNENRLDSEDALFEWPSTYISYVTINNVTTNTTIYCKSKNYEGETSLSAELFVHREFIFEVLQNPSDITIKYGTEGKLFCEVTAYPEATIKWYHNDSAIENTDNVEIVLEDNMILIRNMSLNDAGEYKCEITNEVEMRTFLATVDISGLETPSIEVTDSEYILKRGESMEVVCNVLKGIPFPEVTWKKEVNGETIDVPEGVSVEDDILKISSARAEHSGIYKCSASNVLGEDFKEITVKVQYSPGIKNGDGSKTVNVGEWVQLECDVDAVPKATVHWVLYQDDIIVAFDDRHITDDRYTHRFIAQPQDSGIYYCYAENDVGRSERKVTVTILEAPFIEPLEFRSLRVRVGGSVLVTCKVSLGRPVPVTRWEFISTRSSISVISRQTTTKLDLVLRNISRANEGYYQCVAENTVAPDSVKFYLNVE